MFFGHKVLSEPYVEDDAVGLDTGCVYGGALTAYDCGRDRILTLDADRAHTARASEKFTDPYAASA
ncbi:hypothetical protein VB773_22810 [Haloarculaceae archaeon H-GB2-1]|nr:hypothetical protein [Haloarculaceae archaeon H-GB11]MEA5410127.1 hypothetical protein [Haloarculaceae archaeon H-GB2-1]